MKHITVLKEASIDALAIKPDGIYVDATLGGGGHSHEILKRLKDGRLFSFDQDIYAIKKSQSLLGHFKQLTIINDNFSQMKEQLITHGVTQVDGILFDLGLSSFQIDDETRGFSYLKDYKLDMRMNKTQTKDAYHVVNTYTLEELTHVFRIYSEEKNAYYIAKEIIKRRPVETTFDLVSITDKVNRGMKGHSAKRVFQALRIEVNAELEVLKKALDDALSLLKIGGRLCVITFHSLEDRIVKHFIKQHATVDVPKNIPLQHLPNPPLKIINRKAILPSDEEIAVNKRSHSAKLRVAEKQA